MLFPDPVFLVLSIDVEEEGLFAGKYSCRNLSHNNVAFLPSLAPFMDMGARPTFFCTYGVFADLSSCKILDGLRTRYDIELGCHLHFWNTPPLPADAPAVLSSVPANKAAPGLLRKKMQSLLAAAANFCGCKPASFRMGRWDLHEQHWAVLSELGVQCDASVRPLHAFASPSKGPDHFSAPVDPFWVQTSGAPIFEVPLTVTPLHMSLPAALALPLLRPLRPTLRNWGALTLLPVEHPLWLLKLTTLMHLKRGGRVLSLTWHSSEMMPGGTPHLASQTAVSSFLRKMAAYIEWLTTICNLHFASIGELREKIGASAPRPSLSAGEDWQPACRKLPAEVGSA